MARIFNKASEKAKRQRLRRSMPRAEILLWMQLKGKQLEGWKFRRQYSVGAYVVDFYCPKAKLAIEVDGPSHYDPFAEEYDSQRQQFIESSGIRFLRVTNVDVYENMEGVIEAILGRLQRFSLHL